MSAMASVLLLLPLVPVAALLPQMACGRPAVLRMRAPVLRACDAPPPEGRVARIAVPHSYLMASTATTVQKKKKGIRAVQVGETRIEFAHDMTQSFIWTAVLAGLAVAKVVRVGKSAWQDEPNYKHIARNEAEETELHEFCCEKCGFTMFPARGREGKFFPTGFKCPTCKADQASFFDLTDLSDPRTL